MKNDLENIVLLRNKSFIQKKLKIKIKSWLKWIIKQFIFFFFPIEGLIK